MIWILPEDYNAHPVKRSHIECAEDVFPLRKTYEPRIFAFYEVREFCPIGLLELSCESGIPRWVDIDCHSLSICFLAYEARKICKYT